MIDEAAAWSLGQMPGPEPEAVIILTHHHHSLLILERDQSPRKLRNIASPRDFNKQALKI